VPASRTRSASGVAITRASSMQDDQREGCVDQTRT
jgi:hypothetical protein